MLHPNSAVRSLGRPDRSTLQDRIYTKLQKAIISGRFLPGETISIRGLAAALGTSPIPVREALRRLVAERALEVLPNGSVRVPLLTRERFHDLRRIRTLIEGYATEHAATKISAKEIGKLQKAYEAMEAAAKSGDRKTYLAANHKFRFIIYKAAKSSILLPVIESLWLQYGPFLNLAFEDEAIAVGLKHHRSAIEAMKRRDPVAARKAIQRDILETGEYILARTEFELAAPAEKNRRVQATA